MTLNSGIDEFRDHIPCPRPGFLELAQTDTAYLLRTRDRLGGVRFVCSRIVLGVLIVCALTAVLFLILPPDVAIFLSVGHGFIVLGKICVDTIVAVSDHANGKRQSPWLVVPREPNRPAVLLRALDVQWNIWSGRARERRLWAVSVLDEESNIRGGILVAKKLELLRDILEPTGVVVDDTAKALAVNRSDLPAHCPLEWWR